MLLWLLYALSVYTYQKIHLAKLDSSHSTVESLSYWVCITSTKIHLAKSGPSNSTVEIEGGEWGQRGGPWYPLK